MVQNLHKSLTTDSSRWLNSCFAVSTGLVSSLRNSRKVCIFKEDFFGKSIVLIPTSQTLSEFSRKCWSYWVISFLELIFVHNYRRDFPTKVSMEVFTPALEYSKEYLFFDCIKILIVQNIWKSFKKWFTSILELTIRRPYATTDLIPSIKVSIGSCTILQEDWFDFFWHLRQNVGSPNFPESAIVIDSAQFSKSSFLVTTGLISSIKFLRKHFGFLEEDTITKTKLSTVVLKSL